MTKGQIFLRDRVGGQINVISRFHWMRQIFLEGRVGGGINDDKNLSKDCQDRRDNVEG